MAYGGGYDHWAGDPSYWYSRTVTTTGTQPIEVVLPDEQIRRVVREELADILPIDTPEAPPEEW